MLLHQLKDVLTSVYPQPSASGLSQKDQQSPDVLALAAYLRKGFLSLLGSILLVQDSVSLIRRLDAINLTLNTLRFVIVRDHHLSICPAVHPPSPSSGSSISWESVKDQLLEPLSEHVTEALALVAEAKKDSSSSSSSSAEAASPGLETQLLLVSSLISRLDELVNQKHA